MSGTIRSVRVPSRRRARLLAALVGAVVAALLTTACLPAQAYNVRVTRSMFGMHDGRSGLTSFGVAHEGWIRLWDAGVTWKDIETRRGHYHWARLDSLVAAARAHHASITMVVAETPRFYSRSTPWDVPAAAIPAYKAFVRKLMVRYKGRITSYQVWNEGNITTFWEGTQHRLAQLTKAMWEVRNAVDRKATIVAPPMVTRLSYQLDGISSFARQRLGGVPVWHYYDVSAFNLYPLPRYGGRTGVPEDAMKLLAAAKSRLHRAGVPARKPVWDTEINYGLQSGDRAGTAAAPISSERQAANVVRTYLLQAAGGVKRIGWYRWDWGHICAGGCGTLGNTLLTDPEDVTKVTAAGRAYAMVQHWMHGTLQGGPGRHPCAKDRNGTYTCVVSDASGTRRIYWNPFRTATVKLPSTARHKQGVLGGVSAAKGGSRLTVTWSPVMVYR